MTIQKLSKPVQARLEFFVSKNAYYAVFTLQNLKR